MSHRADSFSARACVAIGFVVEGNTCKVDAFDCVAVYLEQPKA